MKNNNKTLFSNEIYDYNRQFYILKHPENTICSAFKKIKKENPGWGKRTLYAELKKKSGFCDRKVRDIIYKYL